MLAITIKNGRNRALQILGKETDILVTSFSLSNIQWIFRNHSHFDISIIGFLGQTEIIILTKVGVLPLPLLPAWL